MLIFSEFVQEGTESKECDCGCKGDESKCKCEDSCSCRTKK